jgi:hypothetical protein
MPNFNKQYPVPMGGGEPVGGRPANSTAFNSHPAWQAGASGGGPPSGSAFSKHLGPEWITDLTADLQYLFNGLSLPDTLTSGPLVVQDAVSYGPELVVNGGFDTDTAWTKPTGCSISNGAAQFSGVAAYQQLIQGTAVVGKNYRVQMDVVSVTSGSVRARAGSSNGPDISVPGTYVNEVVATLATGIGVITGPSGFTGTIDNISVREVIPATLRSSGANGLAVPGARLVRNQLFPSEPTVAQLLSKSPGVTDGPAFHTFARSIVFPADETTQYAYMGHGNLSAEEGRLKAFSVFVEMLDDLGAPALAQNTSANTDFCVVFQGSRDNATVSLEHITGKIYRIKATRTLGALTSANVGIIQYNTNRQRPFRISGYQFENTSAVSPEYVKTEAASIGKFFPTDAAGDQLFSFATRRTQDGVVPDYSIDPAYKGMQVEPARTNKCTCRKVNPVDITNVTKSGDAAATLTVVDDTAALEAAGLLGLCTSGKVYKLDNSAGGVDSLCVIGGQNGNTSAHSVSCFARSYVGAGVLRFASIDRFIFDTTTYVRGTSYFAGGGATDLSIVIKAPAGSIVYFILPELIEAPFLGAPVVPGPLETDALAAYTRAAVVPSFTSAGRLRDQNCAVWGTVVPLAGGQPTSYPFNWYLDGNNDIGIQQDGGTQVRLRKGVGGSVTIIAVVHTTSAGVPFQYQAFWSDRGMAIRTRAYTGGAWGAWTVWTTSVDARPVVAGGTFQIGARNGSGHFAGNYPMFRTYFMPTFGSLAEYQAWMEARV